MTTPTYRAIARCLRSFTGPQRAFLLHRLAVPDAISDCFAQTPGLDHWTPEQVEDAASDLHALLERPGEIDEHSLTAHKAALLAEILADCCDGSTYLASVDEFADPLTVERLTATAEAAARKVSALVGRVVVAAWC